jgi:hypothetical protein
MDQPKDISRMQDLAALEELLAGAVRFAARLGLDRDPHDAVTHTAQARLFVRRTIERELQAHRRAA